MDPSPELKAALDAAEQAALIARSLYRHNLEVRIKADKSPVTEADLKCELAIREILEARFPGHGFYGEETGSRGADAESVWLVDPIDGTKAFVREYPMFSTQIALMRRGRDRARSLVRARLRRARVRRTRLRSVPQRRGGARERGIHARCGGAFLGQPEVSRRRRRSGRSYGRLVARVNRIRGYGDFLHYHLLAAGKIDAVIESDVNILDIAASVAIVTEAGGRFTDLGGAPITLQLGLGARDQRPPAWARARGSGSAPASIGLAASGSRMPSQGQ